MLDETLAILAATQPGPSWLGAPGFTPVRAFRATDVWDSERVLFIEYDTTDPHATTHTLMAQILEPGGTMVTRLGILRPGAAQHWDDLREPDEVQPLLRQPIAAVRTRLGIGEGLVESFDRSRLSLEVSRRPMVSFVRPRDNAHTLSGPERHLASLRSSSPDSRTPFSARIVSTE